MRKFIKMSHESVKSILILLFLTMVLYFVFLCVKVYIYSKNIIVPIPVLAFTSITGVVFYGLIVLYDRYGLYISDDSVYYKRIIKKHISCDMVCGIKIVKSESRGSWKYDLKNRKGEQLYSLIFVSRVEEKMYDYKMGDVQFRFAFKEHVLFYTIYDEDAIEYFKRNNPNIIVF